MARILLIAGLLFGLPLLVVLLAVEDAPLVARGAALGQEDVRRIRGIVRRNDPRRFRPGEVRRIELGERELNLLLDHGLARIGFAKARVDLGDGSAEGFLSITLPGNPVGRYLNLRTGVSGGAGEIGIERLAVGGLVIPAWIADRMRRLAHLLLRRIDDYETLVSAVDDFELREDAVAVVLRWDPNLEGSLRESGRSLLLPEAERRRLLDWRDALARTFSSLPRVAPLSSVLPPLLAIAKARAANGDVAAEHRALLVSLGLDAIGADAGRLLDPGAPRPPVPRVRLTLHGRNDLARHFLVSAAVTVSQGAGVADALGVFKELDDSIDGSGFSFADLAADRAGVRFAELLTGPDADRITARIGPSLSEADFAPGIEELPEGMMEAEFRRRYRDPESPAYRNLVAEIDRRIAICRLYR